MMDRIVILETAHNFVNKINKHQSISEFCKIKKNLKLIQFKYNSIKKKSWALLRKWSQSLLIVIKAFDVFKNNV